LVRSFGRYESSGRLGRRYGRRRPVAGPAATGGRFYQQIVRDLRDQIERGDLGQGAQIPTEKELMKRYGVSRNTVRKAVSVLASAGFLDTGSTRGTFVRERRLLTITATQYERDRGVSANDAYRDEIEAQGRTEKDREFSLQIVPAIMAVADRLNVETDTLVVCRGEILYVDDHPNAIQKSYYPMDIAVGTALLTNGNIDRGTIRVLKELGHEEIRHRDEISPRMPTEEEDRLLQLGPGVPVLDWKRTAYSNKRPVRFSWRVYAGNGIELVYELGDVGASTSQD
jgi:GntR family transcriptional regulator